MQIPHAKYQIPFPPPSPPSLAAEFTGTRESQQFPVPPCVGTSFQPFSVSASIELKIFIVTLCCVTSLTEVAKPLTYSKKTPLTNHTYFMSEKAEATTQPQVQPGWPAVEDDSWTRAHNALRTFVLP